MFRTTNYPDLLHRMGHQIILQAMLETFALAVNEHLKICDAGFQIIGLMQIYDYHWPDLLDRRCKGQYDLHAEAISRRIALDSLDLPDDWVDLDYPPCRVHTCGRILLQCISHVSPVMLAEAAVIINFSYPDNAQLQRLEILTLKGWQQRLDSRNN